MSGKISWELTRHQLGVLRLVRTSGDSFVQAGASNRLQRIATRTGSRHHGKVRFVAGRAVARPTRWNPEPFSKVLREFSRSEVPEGDPRARWTRVEIVRHDAFVSRVKSPLEISVGCAPFATVSRDDLQCDTQIFSNGSADRGAGLSTRVVDREPCGFSYVLRCEIEAREDVIQSAHINVQRDPGACHRQRRFSRRALSRDASRTNDLDTYPIPLAAPAASR